VRNAESELPLALMIECPALMAKEKKIASFFIESLGCAKNTVDSHSMEKILSAAGLSGTKDPAEADVIIVNTCGFIQPAKAESIRVLSEFAESKKKGQYLIAAGCMSEREKAHINEIVEGLDAALSTRRWSEVLQVIRHLDEFPSSPYFYFPETGTIDPGPSGLPRYALQGKSAYLKIADGCDRGCSFCAIPLIKGPMLSRPVQDIINDAKRLEVAGMREIILIAQDSTAYGRDLGMKDGLPRLLSSLLEQIEEIPWIRIMYTFPGAISDHLVRIMRDKAQILPYLDIPLQHAHPDVLNRMRRPSNMAQIRKTLYKMREAIPEIALRTTFIIGYPGETEQEFEELVRLVEEIEFDHVGIFPYYHESGTQAGDLDDDVPESIKNERVEILAGVQQEISLKKNQSLLNSEIQVLVEGNGDGISIGRSYRDAPEIDGLVFVQGIVEAGKMISVRITGALMHDLIAEAI
jgi:ribosomal protein S12 methylthiotransferase